MLYNAENGTVQVGNTDMDYIAFGSGSKVFIMLPGLGDSLRRIKGTAFWVALAGHKYAQDYRIYMFSRRNNMEEGYSIREMARDQAEAMKALGISKAYVMGVSQGGMIAQCLAIDYPELVEKLVLVVTLSRQNETIQKVVTEWIEMAKECDYRDIMLDTAKKSYTEEFLKKNHWVLPLVGQIGKPKDFSRFLIQARACMNHDVYDELEKIQCPTFVIGGDSDKIVGAFSSKELAEKIRDCKLLIYKGLGHGLYEEADDFISNVLEFLVD